MMKCPRDGTKLVSVRVEGVELDSCPECHGIWCDFGEMERLRGLSLTDIEAALEREYGQVPIEHGKVTGYMRCPRCPEGRLQQITVTLLGRVRVDRCESCLGVWLDAKELEAILGEKRQLEQEYAPSRLRLFMRAVLRHQANKPVGEGGKPHGEPHGRNVAGPSDT